LHPSLTRAVLASLPLKRSVVSPPMSPISPRKSRRFKSHRIHYQWGCPTL